MKKPKTATKKPVTAPKRRLRAPRYQSFKLSKRLKSPQLPLPSSWVIFKNSLRILGEHRRLFGGIALVYAALLLLFVRGIGGGFNTGEVKDLFNEALGSETDNFTTSIAVFGALISSGSTSQAAAIYQVIIVLVCSLATVWALRQLQSPGIKKLRVKDAFYKGMYPLVPVTLVFLVIALQLIPLSLAGSLYNATIIEGLAVTAAERILWLALIFLLIILTLYMLSSSIFALYIATLPDMTPLRALRSARSLVLHRRGEITRKILWLALMLLVLLGLVVLPLIAFVPPLADFIFFVITVMFLLIFHSYMYNLYKAML